MRFNIADRMQTDPNRIEAKHFVEEFGPEGTVPLTSVREYQTISKSELSRYLLATTKSISPTLQYQWFKQISNGLLEIILQDNSTYDIRQTLSVLRAAINPTSGHRLLQRVLSLLLFDGLDAISVSQMDLLTLYNDLNITDTDIQPDIRRSGAAHGYSIKLFQDSERVIRFNIYPSSEGEGIVQDNVVHQHYGAAGSIILAGKLVNQHFRVTSTNDASEFGIYRVVPDYSPHDAPDDAIRSGLTFYRLSNAKISRISSHVYPAGEHYNVPQPDVMMELEGLHLSFTRHWRSKFP